MPAKKASLVVEKLSSECISSLFPSGGAPQVQECTLRDFQAHARNRRSRVYIKVYPRTEPQNSVERGKVIRHVFPSLISHPLGRMRVILLPGRDSRNRTRSSPLASEAQSWDDSMLVFSM